MKFMTSDANIFQGVLDMMSSITPEFLLWPFGAAK
jgi:hypothetical protein